MFFLISLFVSFYSFLFLTHKAFQVRPVFFICSWTPINIYSVLVIYGINSNKYKSFLHLSNMSSMEKSELLKKVGKKIQNIRLEKGMSQVDLVGLIEGNIDTTNISRIESGRTNPTLYNLYRISKALEVPLTDLVNFEKED